MKVEAAAALGSGSSYVTSEDGHVYNARLRAHHLRVESCKWHGGSSICDKCECGEVQDEKHVLFFCKCDEVCELRMRFKDLFEGMFKTLHAFAPSSSEFIPFLAWLVITVSLNLRSMHS